MTFNYRETSVYYEVYGEGIPMVIIHGWGMSCIMMKPCMEPVFEQCKRKYKRIYIDIPGMGKSTAAAWVKNSDNILEIFSAFVEYIVPGQNIMLVGESYGGYLSRGFINKYPGLVEGVILLCPCMIPGDRQGRVSELQYLVRDEEFLKTLSKSDREAFEYMTVILNAETWDMFKNEILPSIRNSDYNFLDNVLDGAFTFDVDDLEQVYEKPALILTGKYDSEVGYLDQFDLIKTYIHASYVMLDRAGHNLHIEQRPLFIHIVREWLNSIS